MAERKGPLVSSPLYRIDRERWESRDRFDMEALDEMLTDGVLVPVDPDQDSAIIALLSPATVKAIGVSMSYNQAKKVVRVVLVGAGIGGDDET